MVTRFGQGLNVDRDKPHIFHRDYWSMRIIREGLIGFLDEHQSELAGKTVLDYGAGDSPYKSHFTQRNIRLIAADINPTDPSIVSISVDTGRIDLPDESVDAIVSTQVLEHVPEVPRYLREGWRVLKPGGWFYCSTHGMNLLHRHPTDLWRWTTDGLVHEMTRAGFDPRPVVPKIGMLANSTYCRAIMIGGLLRRIPVICWLRPILYLAANLRMAVEELITPASTMDAFPNLLLIAARKPQVIQSHSDSQSTASAAHDRGG
jgi:SAM-dependent methyltransferase